MQSGQLNFQSTPPYTPRTVWQTPTGIPRFTDSSRASEGERSAQRMAYRLRRTRTLPAEKSPRHS